MEFIVRAEITYRNHGVLHITSLLILYRNGDKSVTCISVDNMVETRFIAIEFVIELGSTFTLGPGVGMVV